jgi:CRP-like cAMP-binding protein
MRLTTSTISLVDLLPEIVEFISADERHEAPQALMVPSVRAEGELADVLSTAPSDFVVVEGIVLKQMRYAGRDSLELLDPGDVLARPTLARQAEARATTTYRTHGPATLAVIDEHFRAAARRWPELFDVLHDRLARQMHRASMHLAVLHVAPAEDRVRALFSDLAERFGHVTPDGIVIDVDLTHDLIGQLIGSRRPTVTIALERLATADQLTRREDGLWQLNTRGMLH